MDKGILMLIAGKSAQQLDPMGSTAREGLGERAGCAWQLGQAWGVVKGKEDSEINQGDLGVDQSLWDSWRLQIRWDLRPCLIKDNKWAISEMDMKLTNTHHSCLWHIGPYSKVCLDGETGVSPFFQNGTKAFSYKLASEFMKYEKKVKMKRLLLEDLGSASGDWTSHCGKRHPEVSFRSNLGRVSLCVIGISQF